MGKITILKKTIPEILEKPFDRSEYQIGGKCGAEMKLISDDYTGADKFHRAYIFPEASRDILKYIGWGYTTRENIVEQGGILVGQEYYDPEMGIRHILVKRAIPARNAKGSAGFLDISPDDWKEMYLELDAMNEDREGEDKFVIVGWFHTHPNSLDVFMSGTDRGTQEKFFQREGNISVVLNPHRKIWKCFRSEQVAACKAEMLIDETLLQEIDKEILFHDLAIKE